MTARDLKLLFEDSDNNSDDELLAVDYNGFNVVDTDDGVFLIRLQGHAGLVAKADKDELHSPLGLVDEINSLDVMREEYETYRDDDDALVSWAGPIFTTDKQKAEDHPDKYEYLVTPDAVDSPEPEEQ